MANILLKKGQQKTIHNRVDRVLESYDSFVLVEASRDQLEELRKEGMKVVPLDLDTIKVGSKTIQTKEPRIDRRGAILAHPAYDHTRDPGIDSHFYIVQFIGPTKDEWKDEIAKEGGRIGDALPSYSFIVEMDGDARKKVAALPFVRWIGHYDPSYRLAPGLMESVAWEKEAEFKEAKAAGERRDALFSRKAVPLSNTFQVRFQNENVAEGALSEIENIGATVHLEKTKTRGSKPNRSLILSFPPETADLAEKLEKIAGIHGVQIIDSVRVRQLRNNVATKIMANRLESETLSIPFTGRNEIIAVADTGIDTGDQSTIHDDFRGRIVGITSWPITGYFDPWINNSGADDGPADLDSGHGTHVAGSVLGNGAKSSSQGKPIRGLAFEARLFFQAIEQKVSWKSDYYRRKYGNYLLAGIPDDLGSLFQQAYEAGARVHTNSWGGGDIGAYDEQCRDLDQFVWDKKDMVILFAAGNDGADTNRDGMIDPGSITPPSTSKNCIAIGAAENLRTEFSAKYKEFDPISFPRNPVAEDKAADNIDDIAAFSSRGPCRDGRFKPDLVCPGTFVLSTKSSMDQEEGWAKFNSFYKYFGGTSMATPLAAGASALVREYLRKTMRRKPSAALVKAALIHAAVRRPYRHATTDPGDALWDPDQGWGHLSLKPFIQQIPGSRMRFVDNKKGLATGESWSRTFYVLREDLPLKVTMVYTDFPAVAANYPSLVNNLNLILTSSDGKEFHGNVFVPPFDAALDGANNVESILINQPAKGRYKITVLASDVRDGPQDFALVYSGGL